MWQVCRATAWETFARDSSLITLAELRYLGARAHRYWNVIWRQKPSINERPASGAQRGSWKSRSETGSNIAFIATFAILRTSFEVSNMETIMAPLGRAAL